MLYNILVKISYSRKNDMQLGDTFWKKNIDKIILDFIVYFDRKNVTIWKLP